MHVFALFASLLLVLQFAASKKACPPAITRKIPMPGMHSVYRVSVVQPDCEDDYSGFASVYTSTHPPSSTSSSPCSSSTPTPPVPKPFVVDGLNAYFGSFRGLSDAITFCPSAADGCVPTPFVNFSSTAPDPYPNQTVLTNCTDECWMDVSVPGGQQVYVDPTGRVHFSDFGLNGSDIPAGSYKTGFRHVAGNPGYWNFTSTNNNSSGFMICTIGGSVQFSGNYLYADVPGLDAGPLGFCQPVFFSISTDLRVPPYNLTTPYLNVTTTDFTDSAYGAYSYNGSFHECVFTRC